MSVAGALLQAQTAWFEFVDRSLPPAAPPPDGDVLTAALPDGERVAGVLVRDRYEAGTAPTLWSAREVWELHPLVGAAGGAGLDVLLREWRRVLDRLTPGPDSACVVTWPSRDAQAVRALLAHGFAPLSSLAVRQASADPEVGGPAGGTAVRLATMRDLDVALELELAELAYSALVGAAVRRPDERAVKRAALSRHLEQGDPIWLAERDGVPVGLAHCRLVDAGPGAVSATRLPAGRWGYVNCVSVRPEARGTGVGRRLMAVAHAELATYGALGTFLYYNPPNPLASVFWARQGYRPLWTIWEVRPAGALR
ncbi:GNAT family N-acetyltransferase [Actinophytocola xanthii]|uniref:GNAT family N-acetyltransferase n=1 Tax=Actinophytocola xanthii TaxID=1912961 RepID=A0A1Q8CL42_9PSEU|nr:GNAT family N-acetyltransferase [Actinophytocola xanthii]OLF15059.1 GNAT family N-acetyltransferase [Actinophytocola xanthii]